MGETEKQKYWTFYVDMDGVVADFMSAVIELVYDKGAVEPILRGWPKGTYDMGEVIGKSEERIWSAIRGEGTTFWRDIRRYPWALSLINQLQELGDVLFLSSPSRDAPSATGKLQWLGDNFSALSRNFVLTPGAHKWRLAGPTAVLIDDTPDNVDDWNERGGTGILFPQPWNDADEPDADKMAEHVIGLVKEAIGHKEKKEQT